MLEGLSQVIECLQLIGQNWSHGTIQPQGVPGKKILPSQKTELHDEWL